MLLVGKDVKYASSGNTLNAALTPDLLDAGSIGIYLVDQTTGKLKLVTNAASGTGLIPASSVLSSDKIVMFQGLGSGSQLTSEYYDVSGINRVLGSVYRAATAQTVYIGYDPTTGLGDLNVVLLPSVNNAPYGLTYTDPDLLFRQQCTINYRLRKAGNNEFGNHHYIDIPIIPTDTTLSIATKLVAQTNQIQPGDTVQDWTASLTGNFLAAPVQANATTATTGGTVPANTYFATIVYYGTNGNSLGSNEKSITTTGSTSTMTFNWSTPPAGTTSSRVFVGTAAGVYTSYYNVASSSTATLTITALGSPVAGTIPTGTGIGILLTAINTVIPSGAFYNNESPYPNWAVSVFGVIQNATISKYGPIEPSGAPFQIKDLEITSSAYRGDLYTRDILMKHLVSQVDFSATYDMYRIRGINTTRSKSGASALTDQELGTSVAFVSQGNVPGTNQQADWEDIMTSIYPATSQIS